MNRAAVARPSGADAEPEPWERAAFEAAVHSDPIELVGAKRALKAFFFRLLPDIKVEDSFGEADQVLSTLMDTAGAPHNLGDLDRGYPHPDSFAVRTQYMRLAWQSDANAKVRISMDTQLCMFLENPAVGPSTLESGRWFRDPLEPLLPDEVTWFPHAVLELKLGQAEDDDDEEAPEWVSELLASCCHEVHKFSKFVHGTATLLPGFIAQVPYWMDDASIVSSITASHSPRQAAQARQRSKSSVEGALGLVSAEHPVRPGEGDGPTLMDRVDTLPLLGRSRRQGVCGEECCNGLTEGRLCCWGGHAAGTMQRARPIRVEPKVFFANERTFLSWVHMAVIMGSIGGALLGMASKGGDSEAPTTITRTTNGHTTVTIVTKVQHVSETGQTIGLMMISTAICFVLYAVMTYYWRARKIRMRLDGPYDDRVGPGLLAIGLLAGFAVSLSMHIAEGGSADVLKVKHG